MNLNALAVFITKTLIGAIEVFLGLRFFLKILGASQQAAFVRWIYEISDTFLDPFRGMFPTLSLGPYFIIELSTLFAMIAYAIIGFFVIKCIDFIYRQVIEVIEGPPKKHDQGGKSPARPAQQSS